MTNIVNYFEVGSADPDAAAGFFSELFGWAVGAEGPEGYRMIDGDKGGIMNTSALGGRGWATFYVLVDDVDATVERATALGASVALPKTPMGQGSFAHLADPQGNRIGVWQMSAHE